MMIARLPVASQAESAWCSAPTRTGADLPLLSSGAVSGACGSEGCLAATMMLFSERRHFFSRAEPVFALEEGKEKKGTWRWRPVGPGTICHETVTDDDHVATPVSAGTIPLTWSSIPAGTRTLLPSTL